MMEPSIVVVAPDVPPVIVSFTMKFPERFTIYILRLGSYFNKVAVAPDVPPVIVSGKEKVPTCVAISKTSI